MAKIFDVENGLYPNSQWADVTDLLRRKRHTRSSPIINSSFSGTPNKCISEGTDRLVIFRKLESVLETYLGMMGEYSVGNQQDHANDCLLRIICEIHEYPVDKVYGTVGELLQLLFRYFIV
jgi:hypothetical protein